MVGAARPGPPPEGLRPAVGPYRGPIGADGQRPLLAWAGVAARPPPVAALGAHGGSASGGGTSVAGGSGSGGSGSANDPVVDAEGFRLVQGRARPAQAAAAPTAAGAPPPGGGADEGQPPQLGVGGGDSAMADRADDGGEHGAGGAAAAATDAGDAEGNPQAPTEHELREAYNRHRLLVEYLVQQGFPPEDPVRIAAETQADDSRRAWDGARPAKAITLRMRWAEEALKRARRNQAKMEQSIDELDRDYEAKRLEWTRQLNDMRAKTREREEKLAAVARQAAVEFGSADGLETSEPLREAAEALETTVTPTIVGLLEQMPSDSPARKHVEQAVSVLKGVQGAVARASREKWADIYDIGDRDDGDWDDGYYQDDHGHGSWRPSQWDTYDHGWGGHQGDAYGYDGWGSQRPRRWATGWADAGHDCMDTTDARVPAWLEPNQSDAAYARANKRRACEGDDPNGMQGRHAGAVDDGMEVHEDTARLQAAASDTAMEAAAWPAPPTPTAEEHAALEARRQEAWDLAQDQGVEVSQETIAKMGADDLEEWITTNLM